MARSKNLASYPDVYWDLLAAMREGVKELKFKLDLKEARNTQQTFYAFIRALEHTSGLKLKEGDISYSQNLKHEAEIMRGYLVTIDKTTNTLIFVNRDLEPQAMSLREQLKKQLNGTGAEDIKHQPPPVVSLFDKPLEITDEPGVPSAREEPTS